MPRMTWLMLSLALLMAPCLAQEARETEPTLRYAWGLFGGQVSGGQVSKQWFDGRPVMIDDTRFGGGIFVIRVSPRVAFETRLGFGPTKMLGAPNGTSDKKEVDARLFLLDVGLTPNWSWGRFGFGIPVGLGWAVTQTDRNLADSIPQRSIGVTLGQGSGATMFLGLRGTFSLGDRWQLFADLRARRFHRLVNVTERTVKSTEVTFGFLRSF